MEINRYVEKKFAQRVTWRCVKDVLGETGTASKMALILKQKDDGSIKRRIILDMKRSQGNSRAKTDESIVLPRLTDVVHILQEMWKPRGGDKGRRETNDDDDLEIYLVDLEDAFCHFPVRKEELRHCVAPDEHDRDALVWCAMLFGYKAAPLVMGRLSSALDPDGCTGKQTSKGDKARGDAVYSCSIWSEDQLEKGRTWIGCSIDVPVVQVGEPEVIVLGISRNMIDQVLETLKVWAAGGMGTVRDLRSTTGRLSWIGGILPRLCWTVNVIYAALGDVEKEQADGTEERRAAQREDQRKKIGLFPIKPLGGSTSGCSNSSRTPSRTSSGSRG